MRYKSFWIDTTRHENSISYISTQKLKFLCLKHKYFLYDLLFILGNKLHLVDPILMFKNKWQDKSKFLNILHKMNFVPFQIGKIIFQTPNNLLHFRFKQTIKISFHFNWSRFSIIWHVTNQKLILKNNPRSVTVTWFCENKKKLINVKNVTAKYFVEVTFNGK